MSCESIVDLLDLFISVLLAEQGEMCLDQLKSLSDRGMQIMVQGVFLKSFKWLQKLRQCGV
jgi:hypothetical protein